MSRNAAELHLFSTEGRRDGMEWVIEACRPYLEKKAEPLLAYLPLASLLADRSVEETQKCFQGLAHLVTINTETMELPEMELVLRRADAIYIPGGNTFLLNHRLHISHLFDYLQQKLQAGLPLIGVSAGAVLCGPNILTSNDLNMVGTSHFDALKLTPFNFNLHYTGDVQKDEWLNDYRHFHDNPILLIEDDAYIRIRGKTAMLVRGEAWIWRAGHEKERLAAGKEIYPYPEAKNG